VSERERPVTPHLYDDSPFRSTLNRQGAQCAWATDLGWFNEATTAFSLWERRCLRGLRSGGGRSESFPPSGPSGRCDHHQTFCEIAARMTIMHWRPPANERSSNAMLAELRANCGSMEALRKLLADVAVLKE
jgi:hypothetical protein